MSSKKSGPGRNALIASVVGSSIEFYDFYIYGMAASLVFGGLFFPHSSPTAQLLLSYATFSVAFIARPIGAFTFGHLGDRIGRKKIFIISLLIMGGSTVAIGLLPTYATLGTFATALLCLMRFGQGIGLGGLWSGAVLLAIETAPDTHRGRYGMVPQLGYPLGFIAASGVFLLLGAYVSEAQFQTWGWRLPFLASLVLIGLGLWAHLSVEEPRDFAETIKSAPPATVPIVELIRSQPLRTFTTTFAIVGSVTSYYLSSVFSLGFGTTVLGYGREEFLSLLLSAIPAFAAGIIISGFLADRFPLRPLLMVSCLLMAAMGFLIDPLLVAGSPTKVWIYLALSFFLNGLCTGPFGTWMAHQFPARVRFTGTALCYNVGSIIGAGFAPMIAQGLTRGTDLHYVGYYLTAAALISLVAFAAAGKPAPRGQQVPA